ncbi:MAG TPA: outer membrane beta-barrel protein [Blastocatellia bacterium]|nr:outer membrane beta-barrel protein [Blastocatellia bacterium]
MNRFYLIALCLLVMAPAALAQSSDRRVEFFIGYSNLQAEGVPDRNDPNNVFTGDFFDRRKGLHGVDGSITGFFNSGFGLKGDFSFHRNEDSTSVSNGRDSVEHRVTYFMGGPVLKLRNSSRVEPFVHALFGGANTRFDVKSVRNVTNGTVTSSFETSTTDFAMALGGGLNVRLGDKFSLRLFQVDWAPIFLRDRSVNVLGGVGAIQPVTLEGQRQDNVRFSVGVIF